MYYFGLLGLVNVMLNVFRGKVKDSAYFSSFAEILRRRYVNSFKPVSSVRKKSVV